MVDFVIILSLLLFAHYGWFLVNIYRGLRNLQKLQTSSASDFPIVSVIVPFRNEKKNLPNLIQSLTKLNYPKYKVEFILIDDYSTDGSLQWLKEKNLDERFKIIPKVEGKDREGKKYSIELGIQHSTGEIIFITDADCLPPQNWLTKSIPLFDDNTGFVAGSVLFRSDGTLFGNLQQIEFAGLITAAAGLIGAGKPTTCSAANIAFRKKAFTAVNGYAGNEALASGDDELLLQKIHSTTNYKVKFNPSPESIVITAPNETPKEFFNQRKRWASKSLFYNDKFLIVKLALIFLFYLSIPLLLLFGLFFSAHLLIDSLVLFVLKILLDYLTLKKGAQTIFGNYKFKSFLIAELLHIPYILVSAIGGAFGNFEWKKRRLKR